MRTLRVLSLKAHASFKTERMLGLPYLGFLLMNERQSLMGRPKSISVGEMFQSGSGMFLTFRRARNNFSLFKEPFSSMLSIRSLLHFITATSALPLDLGKYDDEFLWCTSYRAKNCSILPAINSGLLSLDSSTGTPNVANSKLSKAMRPLELMKCHWQLCRSPPSRRDGFLPGDNCNQQT